MLRSVPAVDFVLRASLNRVLGHGTVIVPMIRLILLVLEVFRPGWTAMVLLVNVSVMPVRIGSVIIPAMLGIGKHCGSY